MTTAKTLNQIIAELEAWASSHLQVHSFGQGDIWEVSPSSSAFTFPLMWVTPSTAEPRQNELVEQFNVIVCDLVDNGEANELEVLSDTRQILKDLVSWYRQQHSAAYIVEFQGAITPFTERFAERVSGNALTIRLRQPDDYDECAIPLGTPIPAPPFCEPATYTLNDTSTPPNQLSSGSIPSGGSAVIVAPDATVLRDGQPFGSVPSGGSIDVPSDCPPCADATFSIDGVQVDTVASGADLNVSVELNGAPVTPTYNIGTKVIGVTGSSLSTLSVAVSDATPDVGQSITITATPTGFTPTDYYFFAKQGTALLNIGSAAGGVINWTVTLNGSFEIFAQAHDNSASAFNIGGELVTGVAAVITSNLQLYLDPFLSNIVAPTYPDLSGLGRNGTLVNSPTVVVGSTAPNAGGYIGFNGINQRVDVGSVADFSFIQNTLVFSVSMFVYFNNVALRNFFAGSATSSAAKGFSFALDTSNYGAGPGNVTKRLIFAIYRGVSGIANVRFVMSQDNVITTNGWHHVAITMNGIGTAQLYVDGVAVTTTETGTYTLPTGNSTNVMTLGVVSPLFFSGRIAPVQIYNAALTAGQVQINFNADRSRYGL